MLLRAAHMTRQHSYESLGNVVKSAIIIIPNITAVILVFGYYLSVHEAFLVQ